MLIGIISSFPISIGAEETIGKVELTKGEIIEIGSYPQTKVTDEDLILVLNSIDAEWISYNYYISGNASDYMKYKDVEYNDNKYRAVMFTSYRPSATSDSSKGVNSYQDDNGYETDTVYWFKYEPIKWRVLDPEKGFVLCESIIDSQDFYNKKYNGTQTRNDIECYANSYKNSNIRKFLTDTFYNIAFNSVEKGLIESATISSNDYNSSFSKGNGEVTDSVFLLSYTDMLNTSYGFNSDYTDHDIARRKQGTDYAKSQGLLVYNSSFSSNKEYNGNSYWLIRSNGYSDDYVCYVISSGIVYGGQYVDYTYNGVCPALYLNIESSKSACITGEHLLIEKAITKNPTCTETGNATYTCEVCERIIFGEIPALGHNYTEITVQPTCDEEGYTRNECTRCGEVEEGTTVTLAKHTATTTRTEKAATCTSLGMYYVRCSVCDELIDAGKIPAKGHTPGDPVVTEATCTKDGTSKTYCIECEELIENIIIPANGHTPGAEATCTTPQLCTVCNEVVVEAKGHTVVREEIPATCTKDGMYYESCKECEALIDAGIIPAGHKLSDTYKVSKFPTCTEAGIQSRRCEACGKEITEEIPALGHNYKNNQCVRCDNTSFGYYLGDVNKDGKINAADMNYMVKIISGLNEAEESTSFISDVNGDGKVTAVDMNILSKYISGLVKTFTKSNDIVIEIEPIT